MEKAKRVEKCKIKRGSSYKMPERQIGSESARVLRFAPQWVIEIPRLAALRRK